MKDLVDVLEVSKTASDGIGSATKEYEKYLEGIEGKTNQFKASFEALSSTVVNSNFLKGLVDTGTSFIQFLDNAIQKMGGFGNAMASVISVVALFKSASLSQIFTNLFNSIKSGTGILGALPGAFKNIQNAIRLVSQGAADGGNKITQFINALTGLNGASVAATAGLAALAVAITAGIALYQNYKQKIEEARQAAEQEAQAYKDNCASIDEYIKTAHSLREELDKGNLSEEEAYEKRKELISIQQSLIEMFGEEAKSINLVTGEINEQIEAIKGLSEAEYYEGRKLNKDAIDRSNDIISDFGNTGLVGGAGAAAGMSSVTLPHSFWRVSVNDFSDELKTEIQKTLSDIDFYDDGGHVLKFKTDGMSIYEVYDVYNKIYDITNKMATDRFGQDADSYVGDTLSGLSDILKRIKEIKDENEANWEYYASGELTYNEVYKKQWSAALAARKQYDDAVQEGDIAAAKNAADQAKEAYGALIAAADGDESVKLYLERELENFQNIINENPLIVDIKAQLNKEKTSALFRELQYELNYFKDENGTIDVDHILNIGKVAETLDPSEWGENEEAYNRLKLKAEEYGVTVEDLLNTLIQFGAVQGQVSEVIEETVDPVETLTSSLKTLQSEQEAVTAALNEQGSNGSISSATYSTLIALSDEYASCLEYENGAVQLNAEKTKELLDAKTELQLAELELQKAQDIQKWKENSAVIAELEKNIGLLTDAEKAQLEALKDENGLIENNVAQYNLMKSELLELTSAYKAWQDAQSAPESGDMYDSLMSAIEDVEEGLESKKTGTAVYKAAVELLVPEASQEDVKEYVKSLERYLREDIKGVQNFISDALTEGLMVQNGDNIEIASSVTIQDFVDRLKLTPEMVQAIFGELEEYDFHFEWTNEDFEFNVDTEPISEITAQIDAIKAKIEEINNSDLAPEVKDQAITECKEKIDDLTAKSEEIAELNTQIENLKKKIEEIKGLDIPIEVKDVELEDLEDQLATIEGQKKRLEEGIKATADTSSAQGQLETVSGILETIDGQIETVSGKTIGDFGAETVISKLEDVVRLLLKINRTNLRAKTLQIAVESVVKEIKATNSKTKLPTGYVDRFDRKSANAYGTTNSPGGKTLVGELGREIVVSGGEWRTVGDLGAEFVELKKGDIVFNHLDTEKILAGMSGTRGKALAEGNAANSTQSSATTYRDTLSKSNVSGGGSWSNLFGATATVSVDVKLNDKQLEEELADTLDEIQEITDDTLGDYEHDIFLMEKNGADYSEIVNTYKKMQEEVHKTAEKYRALGLSENSDLIENLQAQWWDYQDAIEGVLDAQSESFQEMLDAAHSSLDEIQGVYDTLTGAAQEYADSGFITVDTLQDILSLGAQYMSFLVNENGQLVVNEASIRRVVAAKTDQLAVETSLNYVQQLRTALNNNDTVSLQNLLYATNAATTSTWGLVYAQLAALELNGAQYQAALNNINAIRSLSESAISSIGQETGQLAAQAEAAQQAAEEAARAAEEAAREALEARKEALEETADALDDLLGYVIDMIKQETENQIDAIEAQIDGYQSIVDLKKEALELTKEQDDYNKDVSDRLKEIAKLESQIQQLSLDDSREAQAEKRKLQEELAELNEGLAETQANKSYEATVDSLDKQAEAYEAEKQREIEILEDSISSYQKLYDLAISRISNNWNTLYTDLVEEQTTPFVQKCA